MGRSVVEMNFDCLVGPTHNFGGLSFGNLASAKNKKMLSNPKKAALQGLKKMHFLHKRGFVQGVLPPHRRPHMKSFKNLGFSGRDDVILQQAYRHMPKVFQSLCSSSFMWAANSATVSPSRDSTDKKVHISPSNLVTMFHRSIEHEFMHRIFKLIFANEEYFLVHEALLSHDLLSDEGAANHNRLCKSHREKGLQIFVYGKELLLSAQKTKIFPCRQSRLANESLALRHRLNSDYFLNIEQNPLAIDAGAFHNDVVCVINENVILCHEWAFTEQKSVLKKIEERFLRLYHEEPVVLEISNEILPIEDAVSSYLFNSQLLTKTDGKMLVFAPAECLSIKNAASTLQNIIEGDNPIDEIYYFDISESMANGGGPACLRLRVLLSLEELARIKQSVLLTDDLYEKLEHVIQKYYVEELTLEHFFDKNFLDNAGNALERIAQALGLDGIYDF